MGHGLKAAVAWKPLATLPVPAGAQQYEAAPASPSSGVLATSSSSQKAGLVGGPTTPCGEGASDSTRPCAAALLVHGHASLWT